MKKADLLLSTLYVGIDVSSRNNVVALMEFESQRPIMTFAVANNRPGAMELAKKLLGGDVMPVAGTPYDDAFRTLLNDCPQLILPVLNDTFHEHYTGKLPVYC